MTIDGINIENAVMIQPNLYHFCTSDRTIYNTNDFVSTAAAVYAEFVSLFGFSPVEKIPLLILHTPDSPRPNTCEIGDGFRIRLRHRFSDPHGVFTPREVYVLSHELTHYFFDVKHHDRGFTYPKWNEEIIAETMAIYMLKRLADKIHIHNDDKSPQLYTLEKYLDLYLKDDYQSRDNEMKSQRFGDYVMPCEVFERISDNALKNAQPEIRYLYELFLVSSDSDIRQIMEMYSYIKENNSINYEKWACDCPAHGFIKAMSRIQPKIEEYYNSPEY